MTNLWVILIALAALAGISGGAYIKGRSDGRSVEFAERATLEEVVRASNEAMLNTAATAISQIKVTQTTIRGRVEREVIEKPVYRDCVHPDSTFGLLNDALANRPPVEPASGGIVPTTDGAK